MELKRKFALAAAAMLCCGALVAGVAYGDDEQAPMDPETQAAINAGEDGPTVYGAIGYDQYPGKDYIDDLYATWDQIAVDYAPVVRTLPDGRMVQRTPTEYYIESGAWTQQANSDSMNTYWLDADHRGCGACHTDLATLIKEMDYEHPAVWNDYLGNKMTVQECIDCHLYAPGYINNQFEFGTMIHMIHMGQRNKAAFENGYNGGCMSCHNATGNDMGMELWDVCKYDHLWGIVPVSAENVMAEFSYEQETTQATAFSIDWINAYYDLMRHGSNMAEIAMPQSLFDSWEITIEGLVPEPYTAKLPDLIAEAEAEGVVVTTISKQVCNWNMIGGGNVSNVEITGIPVAWLIEKAGGIMDGANGVRVMRADGSSKRCFPLEKLSENEAFLVYKINGEYLTPSNGFPCTNWVEAVDAQVNSKQVDRYVVADNCPDFSDLEFCFNNWDGNPNGWLNQEGVAVNRPNATVLDVPEGLIIQTGEPFTFHGYADAFHEEIVSMAFSFDNGASWTEFPVEGSDVNKMVWWNLTWTPEVHGAYTLSVKATCESGLESYRAHTVMVVAKDADEIPAVEDTDVYDTLGYVHPNM